MKTSPIIGDDSSDLLSWSSLYSLLIFSACTVYVIYDGRYL